MTEIIITGLTVLGIIAIVAMILSKIDHLYKYEMSSRMDELDILIKDLCEINNKNSKIVKETREMYTELSNKIIGLSQGHQGRYPGSSGPMPVNSRNNL